VDALFAPRVLSRLFWVALIQRLTEYGGQADRLCGAASRVSLLSRAILTEVNKSGRPDLFTFSETLIL
jgi:hypothetical protein